MISLIDICLKIGVLFRGPGMATMFLAHYLVLHSTQTIGAEITRFADRGFYKVYICIYLRSIIILDFSDFLDFAGLVEFAHIFSVLSQVERSSP
jgi:hypothetical protein